MDCTEDDMGDPWGVPGAMGKLPQITGRPGDMIYKGLRVIKGSENVNRPRNPLKSILWGWQYIQKTGFS